MPEGWQWDETLYLGSAPSYARGVCRFTVVAGVDPDAGMLAEGQRRAAAAGIRNVRWPRARAGELPAELAPIRIATFGQSFHWMDRERAAARVLGLLDPGGALVHVSGRKDMPSGNDTALPHPSPPYPAMRELIAAYLGPL